ncbi:MAG: enoyl-CoA hydratase/isomerase family protein [Proteobacteria bacterium]|jgi:enoyl-CoA hydratase/carnithine racemase|nr:enoyl-CoA hydratase/isomerase family protein [Pseudomonadota bacterium]
MSDTVVLEVSERVALITLNRPDKLNAFSDEMLMLLVARIDECAARDDVGAVVLTGAGRGFCSGGDVSTMGGDADNRAHVTKEYIWHTIQAFPKRLAHFDKPIIAAVNGVATGGGLDLALACDLRVAARSARFAETYAKIGLLPGGGGAWFLPHLVGKAWALELLLAADFIDADTAQRIGLVNHVYDDDQLLSEARALAHRMAHMPPLSVRLIKRAVNHALNGDMTASFDLISSHIAIAKGGPDHAEAISAFRERREGKYQGY